MRVSTQFPIAVHALMMLAYFPEERITSEIVAQSVGCNPVIVRNLFVKLKRAGLLSVKAGRGKMELARPAGKISLWDIYVAAEACKADEIFKFQANASDDCPVGCNLRKILFSHLDDAVTAMRDELSGTTLEDLERELETLTGTSAHIFPVSG